MTRQLIFVALGSLPGLGAVPARASAQTPGDTLRTTAGATALQVREVLNIRAFADGVPLALSPDGQLVAFTLRHPSRAAAEAAGSPSGYYNRSGVPRGHTGTDVFVTDTRTGVTRNLTGERGSSWWPAWSPDGRTLAFFSDRDGVARVWLWERAGGALRQLVPDPVRVFFGFEGISWSPDGRNILVKLSPRGMTAEQLTALLPTPPTATVTATPDSGAVTATVFATAARDTSAPPPRLALDLDSSRSFLNAELADLALIDVRTGQVRVVAPHVRVMGYRFAPGGGRIAFSTRQPDGGRGLLSYDSYDLFVADTSGPPRLLVPRMVQEYGLGFSWSPDGRSIAFESRTGLYVVAADGGTSPRRVTPDSQAFEHGYRPPLWLGNDALLAMASDTLWRIPLGETRPVALGSLPGSRLLELVLPADAEQVSGSSVLAAVTDPATKRSGFRRIDLVTGGSRMLYQADVALGGTDLIYQMLPSRDGRTVAWVAESGERPAEVWISDGAFSAPRRLTDLNPDVSRHALGHSRLVQWTGPQGNTLRGALLLPADYREGARYPLIVKVYGGSRLSAQLNRFGLEPGIDNLQLLATRGYAVLLPDAPLRVGTPLADLAATVLPALDSVIAMGVADPARLGLMGHSYGGYSTLAILVQTTRFRAAVSSAGFSNLFSQYGEMRQDGSAVGIGWSERDQGRMGGSPWEFRDRYIANSPYFFLDRVTAPVLLLHGGADRTVLPARAEETFVSLRRLGKEVVLVRYEGEAHHPGSWSDANATDYWNRIFAWFDRYLGAR